MKLSMIVVPNNKTYSTLAWVVEEEGSWALPLCHDRISSFETPVSRAAFQLRQVCQELKVRPISVWDSDSRD